MSRLALNLPTCFMFSVLMVGEICRTGLNIVKCLKVSCTLACVIYYIVKEIIIMIFVSKWTLWMIRPISHCMKQAEGFVTGLWLKEVRPYGLSERDCFTVCVCKRERNRLLSIKKEANRCTSFSPPLILSLFPNMLVIPYVRLDFLVRGQETMPRGIMNAWLQGFSF